MLALSTRSLLVLVLSLRLASGICFCPRVCLPTFEDNCRYRDRTLCVDYEAAQECVSANAEITDAITSMGLNADLFLKAAVLTTNLTPAAASFMRTQTSLAFENNKPVGDCEAGAATDVLVAGTLSHCFSVPVWSQCVKLRDTVTEWAFSIRGFLNNTVFRSDVPPALATQYVAAIGDRAEANTARIRCAAHDVAADQMNAAPRLAAASWPLVAAAALLVALV